MGRSPVAVTALMCFSLGWWSWPELETMEERVELVSSLLARLPGPVLVVLRYLFTFLNQ